MSINSKSYLALLWVFLGLIIIIISNSYFIDVHVENFDKAIEVLFSSSADRLLLFYVITITGVTLQLWAVTAMLKVTWESIKYSYYEYSIGIHIALSAIVIAISIVTVLYAIKAVIGLILISIIVFGVLILNDKKR